MVSSRRYCYRSSIVVSRGNRKLARRDQLHVGDNNIRFLCEHTATICRALKSVVPSKESDFYKTVLFNDHQLGRRSNIKFYRYLPKYPMFHPWSIVRGFVLEGEKLNMVYTEIS